VALRHHFMRHAAQAVFPGVRFQIPECDRPGRCNSRQPAGGELARPRRSSQVAAPGDGANPSPRRAADIGFLNLKTRTKLDTPAPSR